MLKDVFAGDHSDAFHHTRVGEIDVYSVGMGKRPNYGLLFTIGTVDADGELDRQPVRFELPKNHPWREEKKESQGRPPSYL